MPQPEENKTIKIILIAAAIVTIISFINKLLGKDENEKKADKSREKGYKDITPSFEDYVYKDFADTLEAALAEDATEDENAVYGVFKDRKSVV